MADRWRRLRLALPLVLGLVAAGLLAYILPGRYLLAHTEYYDALTGELDNPLMGYAPDARDEEACADTELVFIGLTWAQWEPEEGSYDVEALERTFHTERWRREGKHAVLRFMADVPGERAHRDIPDWLYERTGDGNSYTTSVGSGYAPDYENSYLRERHQQAIAALARWCNQDGFVAYVELGSLGHWGEWHTSWGEDPRIPKLPDEDTCWDYVLDYSDQLTEATLLMRRAYPMVTDAGLGLYHDMVGDAAETDEWQGWLDEGSEQETQGTPLVLAPAADAWQRAPVGGELVGSTPIEETLGTGLGATIEQARSLHLTFLGPNCPTDEELGGARAVLAGNLGYRLFVSRLETSYDFGTNQLRVTTVWENGGVAPFYQDWPVTLAIFDRTGKRIWWQSLDVDLSDVLPGASVEATAMVPYSPEVREGFSVGVVITSPDEREHVRLAMEDVEMGADGMHLLYTYQGPSLTPGQ